MFRSSAEAKENFFVTTFDLITTMKLITLTTFFALIFAVNVVVAQDIIFVIPNGTGNGTSWEQASDLNNALEYAPAGAQLWLAEGTYLPTAANDRSASFMIDKDLKIYGGFNGNETSLTQRDIRTNATVLSGEIGTADFADNSYTVVTIQGASANTVLDGLTIMSGNADGSTAPGTAARCGGAIFNHGTQGTASVPVIRNCIFRDNSAREGGAVYNYGRNGESSPTLVNCTFKNNQADLDGGAIYNNAADGDSNPVLTDCTFQNNVAGYGAGIYSNTANGESHINLNGCVFQDNMAYMWGGGIFGNEKAGFEVALDECSFANNYPTDINKEITVGTVNTAKIRGAK